MENKLTKLYYSIGEVAEMFDVSQSLLRYWQTEFPKLKPKKNKKGDRKYTQKDILYIERIYVLVKNKGFTLEGARKELNNATNNNKDTQTNAELKVKLINIKNKLEKLKDQL
jgi:DNA-binding transcriptional MerR regulator